MKLPRMSVRNLMAAVLAFAAAWWAVETASRRESYRRKATFHARRARQLQSFRDGWVEAIDLADRLLKTDRHRRDPGEVERLDQWIKNILDRERCADVDYEVVGDVDRPDPAGRDEDFRMVMEFSGRNISHLKPLLDYHGMLGEKYERARNRPWLKVPPDPPLPSTPDYQ